MAPIATSALAIVVAFVLSLTIAFSYTRLQKETTYQKTFAEALAVSGVVSALVVLSIGDSIARGIGLVGAVALVRFRSNLRDPRDLIFAFASLATGVAAGAHAFFIAFLGTAVFLIGIFGVARPWFARGTSFDAILTFQASTDPASVEAITRELRQRCRQFNLLRVRPTSAGHEHAYQLALGEPESHVALVHALERIHGVGEAQLVMYDRSQDL